MHNWDIIDTNLPEPGTVADLEFGIPGDAEEMPDSEPDEPTRINDEEDDD